MILTDRRIELLVALIDIDGTAGSSYALADRLDRDYRAVHDDVTLLEKHGMADRNDSHPPRGQQGGNQANGEEPPSERLGLSALSRLFL